MVARTKFMAYAIIRVDAGVGLVRGGAGTGIHVAQKAEHVTITHLILVGGR
jgi:hypothetical protein